LLANQSFKEQKLKRFLIFIAVLATVALHVGSAVADENDEEARAQYERGKELYEADKFTEAAIAFQRAYELKPSFKILYNIGQVENENGDYVRALDAYTRYLEEGGDDVPAGRKAEVDKEIARLKTLVGSFRVEGAQDGAVLMVDGRRMGEAPFDGPVMIKLGEHEVVVKISGEELFHEFVRVAGGQELPIRIEAAPMKEDKPVLVHVPDQQVDGGSKTLRVLGVVALAAGGAAILGTALTGAAAKSHTDDMKPGCPEGVCPPEYDDKYDEAKRAATMSTVLGVVSGLMITTGVVLLIVGRKSRGKNVDVGAAAGPDGAGLLITGRF
jgi:hypothetical protein